MSNRTLGVVIVGTGFGCRVHAPAARLAGLDVVALVGRDPDRTARRAERAGIHTARPSLGDALKLPMSDIVVVATPPATHAELTAEAIAAGRHVLVEKPFTIDAQEARQLKDAADRAGVVALVGHEFRFAPERMTFGHAISNGHVGTPRLATMLGHSALAAPLDMKAPSWWFDPRLGGGWLGAAVSHRVDAIRCWLGEFESVSAVLPMVSGRDPATNAEDSVSARFRMRSGCEGVLQETAGVWGEGLSVTSVAGADGTVAINGSEVTLSGADGRRVLAPLGPPPALEIEQSDDPRHRFTHLELAPAVAQAAVLRDMVLEATPSGYLVQPATFADGVACMEVLDAMRRSAAAGGATVPVG